MSSAMMTTKFGREGGPAVGPAGELPQPGPMLASTPRTTPATGIAPRRTAEV